MFFYTRKIVNLNDKEENLRNNNEENIRNQ